MGASKRLFEQVRLENRVKPMLSGAKFVEDNRIHLSKFNIPGDILSNLLEDYYLINKNLENE